MHIIDVTPENIDRETLFCVKDTRSPGFTCKKKWFTERYKEGLRLKILKNTTGKPIAFIEFLPAELAWRPVSAPGFMFIHCMFVYAKDDKQKGFGTALVKSCEQEAISSNMNGLTVMTSNGSWMTDKRLFEKNGFVQVDQRGRFELMVKKFDQATPDPALIDWTKRQHEYLGWHLVYADQCPWHEKTVTSLQTTAKSKGIDLKIRKIISAKEAQNAPSGFGVFSLLHDGVLLEDHYISNTRFENILKKER